MVYNINYVDIEKRDYRELSLFSNANINQFTI